MSSLWYRVVLSPGTKGSSINYFKRKYLSSNHKYYVGEMVKKVHAKQEVVDSNLDQCNVCIFSSSDSSYVPRSQHLLYTWIKTALNLNIYKHR